MAQNCEGKYGYLITQELKLPQDHSERCCISRYGTFGRRIHWTDSSVVPGAFQMNTSWWFAPNRELIMSNPESHVAKPHFHRVPEMMGFYGSDPENPEDLGGEIELYLNGEQHIITHSSMVYIPPEFPHCPLYVNCVKRPIFHFTVLLAGTYLAET